ncbi:hypothetical protein A3Q56_02354 [Intoshia linei]|uniref:Programmed cell death protein 5 n=1 Tax=Intoshia linei TaxID=1819745 RepID=A0A177B6I3_9BILA|nr:hypothetical protein A3Q56_02354 [Intoshia linei]
MSYNQTYNPNTAAQNMEKQQQMQEKMESERAAVLSQIFTVDAMRRLNILRIGNPERASHIEYKAKVLYQSGQVKRKITEVELKKMLEQFANVTSKQETVVTFDRRRNCISDSEDEDE